MTSVVSRPFLLLLSLVVAGCIAHSPIQQAASGISPTLAMSTYYEEGTEAAVAVGVRPALSRRDRPYMPLEIAVVDKGLPAMTLTAESFTLIDPTGRHLPVAAAAELSRDYGSTDVDRRLGEVEPILRQKYLQYDRIPSNFTPGFRAPIARTQVDLYRFSYFVDLIYFPNPTVPAPAGPFELLVRIPQMQDPLVVRFFIGRPQ